MQYATKISEYFHNRKAFFIIPLYQRAYAWNNDNCKRLFDDILKIHHLKLKSHFFGSIVSVKDNEMDDDLLIIDGQQRLTTIALIVLALKNASSNGQIKCDDINYVNECTENYLFAKLRREHRNIKLRPIENDLKALDALYSNDEYEFVKESGITNNYLYFYERIINANLSFEEIFDALERLMVIDLRLHADDNPQLIFESLNSTGKDLTEADKVRNYLLMSLTKEEQDEYYHKYWSRIEKNTNNDPTMFIRDYLTLRLGRICNIDNLYFEFKEFDASSGIERVFLFEELLKYSIYYYQIVKGEHSSAKIRKKLKQLASIKSNATNPFFLAFFNFVEEQNISESTVYEVLDIVENYWARRIICSYPANVLQKLFATLHNDVLRIVDTHNKRNIPITVNYPELIKHILLKKQGNSTFPNDNELVECFKTRQIYKLPIDYRSFLFERLENENSLEANHNIISGLENQSITIEHIMPQTLTTQWKEDIGENWEEIHNKYLHTFANLTLTGYNSNYGNMSFNEKKVGYINKKGEQIFGFKDSGYRLSNYIKTCDKWTLTELEERQKLLTNKFQKLWPMISSAYVPLEKEIESVSFSDDDYVFSGRTIMGFSYKRIKYSVDNWKEFLILLCKLIYQENKLTMDYLCRKEWWVHVNDAPDRSFVATNCYVHSACNTKTKKSIIKYLFKECNISEFDLEIHLQPLANNNIEA